MDLATAAEEGFLADESAAAIGSLAAARDAVQSCRRCPLYRHATQAVFGAGPQRAGIMFVGEQPGDREDLSGDPFVGPAGRVFDAALAAAGIARKTVYVTNAVKHFKFRQRGKKRLHQKPDAGEIRACRFWLDLERRFIRPQAIVAMGATAARSLLGRTVTISSQRGNPLQLEDGAWLFVTVHPSYLLRIRDRGAAAAERQRFEADLEAVRERAQAAPPKRRRGAPAA
jgi:uracil-DNA glycosylase